MTFFEPVMILAGGEEIDRRWHLRGSAPRSLRDRAVRLVREPDWPIAQIAADLGIHREALRTWVCQPEADAGQRSEQLTSVGREELKQLRKQNNELKRANEILKAASAFFAAGSAGPGRGSRGSFRPWPWSCRSTPSWRPSARTARSPPDAAKPVLTTGLSQTRRAAAHLTVALPGSAFLLLLSALGLGISTALTLAWAVLVYALAVGTLGGLLQ
ncbi:transposase [Actinomadura syzygii]|uniref:Transposase n=1 Tax=Actinomadura syzygii TaxID=1427538 RepID=A0A5D0UDL3_9ACTN|nr:transposase [Actinomadura syzygii]TYC15890.1 transposase [Actinomadura syzygii]